MTPGTVSCEPRSALRVHDSFRHDRTSRIARAEEQDVVVRLCHVSRSTSPLRLDRTNERTQKLAINLRCDPVNVNILACKELTSVFNTVETCWFQFDLLEASGRQLASVFVLFHCPGDAAHPREYALPNLRQHLATNDHIGDGESSARFQYSERFTQNGILVSGQIDDAVRDDDIDGFVGERNMFDLAFE